VWTVRRRPGEERIKSVRPSPGNGSVESAALPMSSGSRLSRMFRTTSSRSLVPAPSCSADLEVPARSKR